MKPLASIAVLFVAGVAAFAQNDPPTPEQVRTYVPAVGPGQSCSANWGVKRLQNTDGSYVYVWENVPVNGGEPEPWSRCYGSLPIATTSSANTLVQRFYLTDTRGHHPDEAPVPDVPFGFKTNACLLYPLMPGDFLPRAETLGASSECLLPPGMSGASTGWQGIGRPTLEGAVDLITGLPLVQVTDLELPFDGATFRLNRTRSSNHPFQRSAAKLNSKWEAFGSDKWWDWAGQGWMLSENPILLIDSKLPDAVGNNPATCWLILDAHHSIPFQMIESNGKYEAPPRFRATLTTDAYAQWVDNGVQRHWAVQPREYKVSLYDGAITYTFVVIRDDVPPKGWMNFLSDPPLNRGEGPWVRTDAAGRPLTYHDRPLWPNSFPLEDHFPYNANWNPGFGIPYYAICTKIEDRYGHSVEIEYSPCTRESMDLAATPDCIECRQNCLAKGQIRTIKLKTNGATKWTLVYVHRLFAGVRFANDPIQFDESGDLDQRLLRNVSEQDDPKRYTVHGELAVERIYVYPGELPNGQPAPALPPLDDAHYTIDHTESSGFNSSYDHLEASGAFAQYPAYQDWQYMVRYHYNTYTEWVVEDGYPAEAWRFGWGPGRGATPPTLLMTTVATRSEASHSVIAGQTNRVYWYGTTSNGVNGPITADTYDQRPDASGTQFWYHIPWLQAIFTNDDIAKIMSDTSHAVKIGSPAQRVTLAQLASQRLTAGGERISPGEVNNLLPYASWQINAADPTACAFPESGVNNPLGLPTSEMPTAASLLDEEYVTGALANHLRSDIWNTTARDVRLNGALGSKSYRIHRFVVQPKELPAADGDPSGGLVSRYMFTADDLSSPGTFGIEPMASIFLNPYSWQNFTYPLNPNNSNYTSVDLELVNPPLELNADALTEPRFIAIIDEFDHWDEMTATDKVYDGPGSTKEGQRSRRVVSINAWGVVLTDRHWEYSANGVSRSGSGAGKQYIYNTVGRYFNLPLPSDEVNPGEYEHTAASAFRNDLLLVETRSAGWSLAENDGNGDTTGRIDFNEYSLNQDTSLLLTDYPWSARLQKTAEGIRKGKQGESLYRGQWLYDTNAPNTLICTLRFVEPRTTLFTAPPAFGPEATPELGVLATHVVIERDQGTASTPLYARPIKSITTIDPPVKLRPDPAAPFHYPVNRFVNDEYGQKIWDMVGLLTHPLDPSADTSTDSVLALTYTLPSTFGPIAVMQDAVPGAHIDLPYTDYDHDVPTNVDGWNPKPSEGVRLKLLTSYLYDTNRRLTDIWYPNGRRYARRDVIHRPSEDQETWWREEYEFPDLVPIGSAFITNMPCIRREFRGNDLYGSMPLIEEKGYCDNPVNLMILGLDNMAMPAQSDTTPRGQGNWRPMARQAYTRDVNGRVVKIEQLEYVQNAQGVFIPVAIGSKEINDLGEMYRSRETDGTITRLIRNSLGRTLRKYVGTVDHYWSHPDLTTNGPLLTSPEENNMVLVERFEYGEQPENLWMPTRHIRYTTNQDFPTDTDPDFPARWHQYRFGLPSGAAIVDPKGEVTAYGYDWRMRKVRTDIHAQGFPDAYNRLMTTLSVLDHADRVRLEITYGRGALPDLSDNRDPALLGPLDVLPTPSHYLRSGELRPLSLKEFVYGPGGQVIETRTYDVQWGGQGAPGYQSQYELIGFGGTAIFRQGPGDDAEITRLDAVGRTISTATVRPAVANGAVSYDYEIARTDYYYDADSNVSRTVRWERVTDAPPPPSGPNTNNSLSSINAVYSTTVNWYDVQKRVVATAEIGSGLESLVCDGAAPGDPSWYSVTARPAFNSTGTSEQPQDSTTNQKTARPDRA